MRAGTSVGTPVGRFVSWWGSELRGLLPGAGRARTAAPRIIVSIEDTGFRLLDGGNAKLKPLDRSSAGLLNRPDMLTVLGRRVRSRAWRNVGIRVRHASCFVRHVEVPAGAEQHVAKLLALDLQRNSPFLAHEIRSAYYRDPSLPSNGKLPMRQLIIKRSAVDGLIADVEDLGADVVRLDCWAEDGVTALPVDFLEADMAPAPSRPLRRAVHALLGMSALALAGAAVYIVIDRHEAALRDLRTETAKLKTKALAARDGLTRAQGQYTEFANLQRARTEYISKPRVLDELTRLLPDTVWISDMRIEGSTIDVTGLASSASGVVKILERSNTFVDATLTAPLTFDQREDKERFSLRMKLRAPTVTAGSPAVEARP